MYYYHPLSAWVNTKGYKAAFNALYARETILARSIDDSLILAKIVATVQTRYAEVLGKASNVPRAIFLCCMADEFAVADIRPTIRMGQNSTDHPWSSWYRIPDRFSACLAISVRDIADVCRSPGNGVRIAPDPSILDPWSGDPVDLFY